jgi:alpha-mannosidase
VPDSVREFRRAGVVYRPVQRAPECETSLVWAAARTPPALERFVAFARQQLRSRA